MRIRDRHAYPQRPLLVATCIAVAMATVTYAAAAAALVPFVGGIPWPPAGAGLVAVLLFGYDVWSAILAGVLVGAMLHGSDVPTATLVATASSLEALAGGWLANRWACGADSMGRTRCFVRFAVVTGVLAAAVGPVLGFPALTLIGRAPQGAVAAAALTWWLGDGVTTLVVAPALLLTLGDTRTSTPPRAWTEAIGLAIALGVGWLTLFCDWLPTGLSHDPLDVLCVPALLWAAYRFGPRVASLAVAGLAIVTIGGTHVGVGPFALKSAFESQVSAFAFIGVLAVTTLSLAIVTGERRSAEKRLRDLARTDGLTGLANFRVLRDALAAEIARGMRRGRRFAVLLLDLDRLKEINDTLGHLVGNRALLRVAGALQANSRSMDTAARIGGDEFCLVLPDTNAEAAAQVAARIRQSLEAAWDGPRVQVSSGLAVFPEDGGTADDLLAAADAALYTAKPRRSAPAHVMAEPVA